MQRMYVGYNVQDNNNHFFYLDESYLVVFLRLIKETVSILSYSKFVFDSCLILSKDVLFFKYIFNECHYKEV